MSTILVLEYNLKVMLDWVGYFTGIGVSIAQEPYTPQLRLRLAFRNVILQNLLNFKSIFVKFIEELLKDVCLRLIKRQKTVEKEPSVQASQSRYIMIL